MYDQPRYRPLQASTFFDDGSSARLPVPGTVARGQLDVDEHLHSGRVDGKDAATFPFPIDRAALERGRERFNIYCSPCHGEQGDGRGMIVRRGFSPPPSFHEPRGSRPTGSSVPTYDDLRKAPPGHFFEVITEGHGTMYSYASRIAVDDRWKIVAYIRALQLSRHATLDDLAAIPNPNDDERKLLREGGR
jgi:mono/diheme cytochrome c family protein